MALSADDRLAITDVIALHGLHTDAGELERYDEVFTADVVYDVTELGGGVLHGLPALIAAGRGLGAGNPVAHVVTNVVLTQITDDETRARSTGLGIRADGTTGAVGYEDSIVRTPAGWRIGRRVVRSRSVPLSGRF